MTSTLERPDQTTGPNLDPKRFRALAIIAVAQLMVVLDASVVIIALPSAQRALHISTANRQWMLTAYTLSFAGLLLLGGRIADYFGRKRMFVISLVGFAAASALGGLAQNSAMLFSARALQGAFAAVMAPAALSLLTVAFTEPKERARAFAVYGGIAGGGAAIGLILGGVLTEFASWRWTLLINVPIAIAAAVAAYRFVSESRASANPATTFRVPRPSPGACWRSSTGSPRRAPTAGARRSRSPCSVRPPCSWSPSSSSSCGPRTRSCRCGSSSTATGAGRSWPRCWSARRSSAPSSR